VAKRRGPDGDGLPAYVEGELRRYLACGILAHGFTQVRCAGCKAERLVAFSCKGVAWAGKCRAADGGFTMTPVPGRSLAACPAFPRPGMPGLRELEEGARRMEITYRPLPNGGEIRFRARDIKLVTAVHRWFGAQLSEHGADARAE